MIRTQWAVGKEIPGINGITPEHWIQQLPNSWIN